MTAPLGYVRFSSFCPFPRDARSSGPLGHGRNPPSEDNRLLTPVGKFALVLTVPVIETSPPPYNRAVVRSPETGESASGSRCDALRRLRAA